MSLVGYSSARDEPAVPVAVTARAFVRAHSALTSGLREAGFDVRYARTWEALLAPRGPEPALILVDYDDAGRCADGAGMSVSGHRLVTLLARHCARERTALVVLTNLDYAEVEDLAHAGVHAFVSPRQSVSICLDDVLAAVKRQQSRRSAARHARLSVPVVTVPVLTPPVLTPPVLTPPAHDVLALAHAPASLGIAQA
jgi:DNA-binding NarL/FixJ family response regulator